MLNLCQFHQLSWFSFMSVLNPINNRNEIASHRIDLPQLMYRCICVNRHIDCTHMSCTTIWCRPLRRYFTVQTPESLHPQRIHDAALHLTHSSTLAYTHTNTTTLNQSAGHAHRAIANAFVHTQFSHTTHAQKTNPRVNGTRKG